MGTKLEVLRRFTHKIEQRVQLLEGDNYRRKIGDQEFVQYLIVNYLRIFCTDSKKTVFDILKQIFISNSFCFLLEP